MNIIDRYKRGEVTLVELMEQVNKSTGRDGRLPDRRKEDRIDPNTPRRRKTDHDRDDDSSARHHRAGAITANRPCP